MILFLDALWTIVSVGLRIEHTLDRGMNRAVLSWSFVPLGVLLKAFVEFVLLDLFSASCYFSAHDIAPVDFMM